MYKKVNRAKGKDAKTLAALVKNLDGAGFESDRVYAHVDKEDREKARGMKEAIAEFKTQYRHHGAVLQEMIDEKRKIAEEHMYFGVNPGSRLTTEDYINVMRSIGLSESTARSLYPELLTISRKLEKEREEERSVLVGKYDDNSED
jgi:hypothetical protein